MEELDQVLEALGKLEAAEGLEAVNEILGPDLVRYARKVRAFKGAGDRTAREVVLKLCRLHWQKGAHKGAKERG